MQQTTLKQNLFKVIYVCIIACLYVSISKVVFSPPKIKIKNLQIYLSTTAKNYVSKFICDNFSVNLGLCTLGDSIDLPNEQEANVDKVLSNQKVTQDVKKLKSYIHNILFTMFITFIVCFPLVWLLLHRLKKYNTSSIQYAHSKIYSSNQINQYLAQDNRLSDLKVGDLNLPLNSELTNILSFRSQSDSQNQLIQTFIKQIREKDQPAIIIDSTGKLTENFYSKEKEDIIFNPTSQKSYKWDLKEELDQLSFVDSFFKSMFVWGSSMKNEFLAENAYKFVKDCYLYCMSQPKPNFKRLHDFICNSPISNLLAKIQDLEVKHLLESGNTLVISSLINFIRDSVNWFKCIEVENDKSFLIRSFCQNVDLKPGGWLFVSFPQEKQELFKPCYNIFLSTFISSLQRLQPNSKRRFWFIADELANFGNLNEIQNNAADLGKYQICLLSAIQNINHLLDLYGPYQTHVILSQFRTKFFFKGNFEQEFLNSIFGYQDLQNNSENIHTRTNTVFSDSPSPKLQLIKPLMSSQDIRTLKNFESYVVLANSKARYAKIQTSTTK